MSELKVRSRNSARRIQGSHDAELIKAQLDFFPDLLPNGNDPVREITPPDAPAIHASMPSLPIYLNPRWRIKNERLQWIVQRRRGNGRARTEGWVNDTFFRTKEGLLFHLPSRAGEIDPEAWASILLFPDFHP